ncbi:MAG: PDZ domain-containing protein [Myxococcota bacterium]
MASAPLRVSGASRHVAAAGFLLLVALLAGCPQTISPFPTAYVGVGVELTVEGGTAKVVRVIPSGPADSAGITPGTRVLEVDGHNVEGKSLAEVVNLLRGPPGSTVQVKLRTTADPFNVTLTRRELVKSGADGGHYVSTKR